MTKFNVIWEPEKGTEIPSLSGRTREQALQYIEHYFSDFIQVAVNIWQDDNGQRVKLEKIKYGFE